MENSEDSPTPSSSEGSEEPRNSAMLLVNNVSAMIARTSIWLTEGSSSGVSNSWYLDLPLTTYDKSLSVKHEYLGTELEDVRGRTLYDEGSIVLLPILMELGVVLVPGQTLPLTSFHPSTISMFKKIISVDRTFGVVCRGGLSPYGTTAEIFQYQEDSNTRGFTIKAKGRQRFKLLEEKRQTPGLPQQVQWVAKHLGNHILSDGEIITRKPEKRVDVIFTGKVLILPEVSLLSPLHCPRFSSLDRHRNNSSMREKISFYDAAPTPWPSWVYRQYDTKFLVNKIMEEIKNLDIDVGSSILPTDPLDFSFWLAQSITIDGKSRLQMLTLNTTVERLQYALSLVPKREKFYCSHCGNCVAEKKDVFSMSTDGPQSMYCNPGGYVHDIITLYKGQGMTFVNGVPSTEYSWFPGYGWIIAQCGVCDCHMGWLFTAMKKNLRPEKFWGLSRRSISTHKKVQEMMIDPKPMKMDKKAIPDCDYNLQDCDLLQRK